MKLILSCEHASNRVPPDYQSLFVNAKQILCSHRGWDPGSLTMGQTIKKSFPAPLFQTVASRLLVEPNRSLGHSALFSEFTRNVDEVTRQAILQQYYFPYRSSVEDWIREQTTGEHRVLHVSVHSFVPELNGQVRSADIGLLYDPKRQREQEFCLQWRSAIKATLPDLKVRRNYPYLGSADGFTTFLRRKFPSELYLGIELEVNQRHLETDKRWQQISVAIANSLKSASST